MHDLTFNFLHRLRWFQLRDVQPVPSAKFLDCILYSREQLVKEYQAMPEKGDPEDLPQVFLFVPALDMPSAVFGSCLSESKHSYTLDDIHGFTSGALGDH